MGGAVLALGGWGLGGRRVWQAGHGWPERPHTPSKWKKQAVGPGVTTQRGKGAGGVSVGEALQGSLCKLCDLGGSYGWSH